MPRSPLNRGAMPPSKRMTRAVLSNHEPKLKDMLDDPVMQALMASDRVERRDVERLALATSRSLADRMSWDSQAN